MKIVTKRNGKVLMALGLLLITTGALGSIIYARSIYPSHVVLGALLFLTYWLGLILAVTGTPIFIISAKRARSKLIEMSKGTLNMRTRTKISSLAQQLAVSEKDVISMVLRLKSSGEPISIDDSTQEIVYEPILLAPSRETRKTSMTSYEILTVILTIIGIIISIIIAFMK